VIAPQPPPPQVFIAVQSMLDADVPSQYLTPVAAIQTHHVIVMNGSAHRHSWDTNFLRLNRLSKLTDRPMY
jgi:hypothetical protein